MANTLTQELEALINGLNLSHNGSKVFLQTERLDWESIPKTGYSKLVTFCLSNVAPLGTDDFFGSPNKLQTMLFEFKCETADSLSKAECESIINAAINRICELESDTIVSVTLLSPVLTDIISNQQNRTRLLYRLAVDTVDYLKRFNV